MRDWRWRKGLVGLLALLAFFAVASSAQAASYMVNSTADGTQFNPGSDTTCETALGNNQCTLRAAVMETNAIGGTNTINLPSNANPYKLTIAGQDNNAHAGDLDVIDDQSLTIIGGGASSTTIDGNHIDRVFDVASGSSLTLSGVTIENGKAPAPASGETGDGGAIRSNGTLVVSDSTLVNNTTTANGSGNAGAGGGVSADGTEPTTLTNVNFTTDSATSGGNCGAVAEEGGGQVTINGGTMDGNSAMFCGAVGEIGHGHVDVTGTTIRNSNALLGTGLGVGGAGVEDGAGILTFTNAVLTGNSARFGAGVAESGGGEVDVTNTTIAGNHAMHTSSVPFPSENGSAGAIGEDGGGTVKVLRSTISGNTADNHGGGIMANGGTTMPIVDSTIANNTASSGGGGGVRVDGGDTVSLLNDTVSGNSSKGGGNIGICDVSQTGDNFCDGHVALQNSIVAAGSPANCATSGGIDISIDSHGHNIDSGTSCGFTQAGDLSNTNPLLGPLQPNGGPTQTEALESGSPAINAADNTACGTGAGLSGPSDQRGLPRIVGSACDIGAFEVQPASSSPGSGPTTALGPPAVAFAKPRIRVSGVPRGCVRGTFHLTVTITSAVPLKKVRIARDGHALHSKKKKQQRLTINAGSLGQGRHRIKISARNSAGVTNKTVSFRRCAPPVVLPRFTG